MKAIAAARRSDASDIYTPDRPVVIYNHDSHQRMKKTEVRPTAEDDPQRAAFIDKRWAALQARRKH